MNEPTSEQATALLNVLEVIEDIVSDAECFDWSWMAANKRLRGRPKAMQEKLASIYRIAHGCNTRHSCYRVHAGWRTEAALRLVELER